MSRSRVIRRPTVVNMRDLGGLPAKGGGWLARAQVFRAAKLTTVSQDDALWLRGTLHLRTLFDLRTEPEIERDGRPESLIELGVTWRSSPVQEQARVSRLLRPDPSDYFESYCAMLDPVRPSLCAVMETIADGRGLPLAISCTAGKDRTGVLVALLLRLLGVSSRVIAADYALTARCLRWRLAEFEHHRIKKGLTTVEFARRFEARPETMLRFLAWIDREYGVQGLRRALGLAEAHVDAARRRVLRSTAEG
jgi:hypothetical protein